MVIRIELGTHRIIPSTSRTSVATQRTDIIPAVFVQLLYLDGCFMAWAGTDAAFGNLAMALPSRQVRCIPRFDLTDAHHSFFFNADWQQAGRAEGSLLLGSASDDSTTAMAQRLSMHRSIVTVPMNDDLT